MNDTETKPAQMDVRLRLFISEMIAVAALITFILPYIIVSSQIDQKQDVLRTYLFSVVVATVLVVVSSAYPISRLTQPIREYERTPDKGGIPSQRLLEVRARALNLPILFTSTAVIRYWTGCFLIVAIMWSRGTLSGEALWWLLVKGMLGMTPGFVFLFFVCERIVQPVRQSIALACRGLRGESREGVFEIALKTRFALVSLVMMALALIALGVMSYQQLAALSPDPASLRNHMWVLIWLISASIFLTGIIAILAAESISGPLARAAKIMEAVGHGNLDLRVDVLTNDETASLGESFNYMVDQLQESQRQLRAANQEIRALNRDLEQKVLERTHALQLEASKNNVILQSIADGVMVFASDQRAILANKSVGNMLGLDQEEILGKDVRALVQPSFTQEERDRSLALLTGLLLHAGDEGASMPVFLKFKLGGRTLSASFAPITEPTSELQGGFVAVYRDITEQETAEDLSRQNRDLLEANRLKSQFLAVMSHELRTPMNSIIGYCQVLLRGIDGGLNEEQTTDVGRIMDSGQDLLAIINDILDLSKIDAGRLDIRLTEVDLGYVLESVLSSMAPLAERKSLTLELHLQPNLRQIYADTDRLRQVLMNLLSNAIKFTREGGVRVHVRDDGGGHLRIVVEDDGVGIAAEDHEAIFNEFYQVDASRTREFGGTGLGLAITKRLLDMMGGHIWVESTPECGARFTFTIPVAAAELDAPSREPESVSFTAPPVQLDITANLAKQERVLLAIDDDPSIMDLLQRFLAVDGYRVVGAITGEDGLKQAEEIRPIAITLDLILPDMGGLEVLQRLKSRVETEHIPVLVLSMAEDRQAGMSLGVVDQLQKPIQRETLLRKVRQLEPGRDSILVADDDPGVRQVLATLLREEGHQVQLADNGAQVLSKLEVEAPDLLILDLMMAPIHGLEILSRVQNRGGPTPGAVLVLTARELSRDEQALLDRAIRTVSGKGLRETDALFAHLREQLTLAARQSGLNLPRLEPVSCPDGPIRHF